MKSSSHNALRENGGHRVAIVGARGYSGIELARILLKHPNAQLCGVFATDTEWNLSEFLPSEPARSVPVLAQAELEKNASQFDTVFLATPNEISAKLAPLILSQGTNVIDLSGEFRLGEETDYGLVPYAGPLGRAPESARLIANPGCYATSVLMAILPLLKTGLIDPDGIVIDAKSGTTGAGKKASENLLFSEVDGECLPYRVGKHQHLPEIRRFVKKFAGIEFDPMFTTHLLPVKRGIISGIYCQRSGEVDAAAIAAAYEGAYSSYPFVRVSEGETGLLALKNVIGTPYVNISYVLGNGRHLYLFATIDNLWKGAASQAVENLNRILDLPIEAGLDND